MRLFPRNPEKQEEAVAEFWGFLIAGERDGAVPILARYDGQRPLVPWLIRVFQNKHLSDLRHERGRHALPEDDLDERDLPFPSAGDDRWHEEFRQAAREWLADLPDNEALILGLRLRYRLSQREAATVLGINEGNVSRQTTKLRDRCLERIGARLQEVGWTGDDLSGYILKEMDTLLLDEPRSLRRSPGGVVGGARQETSPWSLELPDTTVGPVANRPLIGRLATGPRFCPPALWTTDYG